MAEFVVVRGETTVQRMTIQDVSFRGRVISPFRKVIIPVAGVSCIPGSGMQEMCAASVAFGQPQVACSPSLPSGCAEGALQDSLTSRAYKRFSLFP